MSDILSGPLLNTEEIHSSNQDVLHLKELDELLKCRICYEYFDTCVVTDCSHNFCSLCIRKYIQFKTECPVCFKELYDSQLRANRIMDNVIEIFPPMKDRLIRYIRSIKTLKPNFIYVSPSKNDIKTPKKRVNVLNKTSEISVTGTDDSSPFVKPSIAKLNTPSVISTPNHNKVIISKIFQSPAKKNSLVVTNSGNMVACPVCSVEIPERNINLHLDACLNPDKDVDKKKHSSPMKRTHLPKLVFRLMSTTALRSKAKEYGLNAHGDNETLKNRIQRYTVLYNAECDKTSPRPVHEIIRLLEKEEKVLANQKLPKSIFTTHTDDATTKEELMAHYLKENKKSFEDLIEKVKQRQRESKNIENTNASESEKHQAAAYDYCQPSTSKLHCTKNVTYNDDMIKIDEIKVEQIKDEPTNSNNVGTDNVISPKNSEDEEEDFVTCVLKKRRLRTRRLNFDDYRNVTDTLNTSFVEILPVKVEPEIEIYEAMTDEDEEKPSDKTVDEINETSSSPVIQKLKPSRRKRQNDDQTAKKSLRKRKR